MRAAIVWILVIGGITVGCGKQAEQEGPVHGVILFVGDGMGVAVVTAARVHRGYLDGLDQPGSARLHLDRAPRGSLLHTWSSDRMVTDSAAGITALVAGAKVPNGALSAAPKGKTGVDTLITILEIAEARGMATGVVTTTRLTHATPAGCYAHVLDRGQEAAIAASMVPGSGNSRLGDGMEVILGGGRRMLLPGDDHENGRQDGRDLLSEMENAGYRVVDNASEMEEAVAEGAERLLGVFTDSHMSYEADRKENSSEPSLAEMTRAAIDILSRDPDGFFLLVEGGRIDHALHGNNGYRAITDMLAFDEAVGEALKLGEKKNLILVTADHDHTMVLTGFASSGSDVFTQAGTDLDKKPYTAILYATGPSAAQPVPDTLDFSGNAPRDFRERAAVPLRSELHGAMDVPLYAFGPERYLQGVQGSMDNTQVFDLLRDAVEDR